MAGTYYSATPIGAGMGNIAEAISGIPARREQAALLSQRRDLVASQILTDASRRGEYDEKTAGLRQTRMGREGMAAAISGTSGGGGPDADPQPSAEPSISTAFMADRMPGDPISVAPAAPATPNVAGAIAPQQPSVGWTPEQNRRYYSQAVLANEDKAADYVRGYMGGNMAATETNPDKALSYGQAGAGQSWKTTPTGEGAQLKETARKNDQASADRRFGSEQSAAASRYGADARANASRYGADVRGGGTGKAGKGRARELTSSQQSKLLDEVNAEVHQKLGRRLTKEEGREIAGAISDSYASGDSYLDAKAKALDGIVSGDKGEDTPWYNPFTRDTPDTRKLNMPARTPREPAAAQPAQPGQSTPQPGPSAQGPGFAGGSSSAAAGGQADILNQELRKAQAELTTAQGKGDQDAVQRAQGDITAIQRELGRLPGGKRAAPAPAAPAAAPAAATAKASASVDEWKSKAKAKGWSDKQIADALKSKGF